MSNIQNLTASLDLKQNLNIYANCKQFDNLNLILLVYDNSVQADLSNYNVRLVAMKADKIPLIQEHTGVTINNNIVTIAADEQLTTTSGRTLIELQFVNTSTGKRKATFNLALMVNPSTLQVDSTISTATYTLMQQFVNELDRATDYFNSVSEFQSKHPEILNLDSRVTAAESTLSSIPSQEYITNKATKSSVLYQNAINEQIIPFNTLAQAETSILNGALNITFWGDSITEGINQLTYSDTYAYRVTSAIKKSLPNVTITSNNFAIEGTTITNAIDDNYTATNPSTSGHFWRNWATVGKTWKEHIKDSAPDLLFVAFGMNEAGGLSVGLASNNFITKLSTLINYVKSFSKVPSIVVVTPMVYSNNTNIGVYYSPVMELNVRVTAKLIREYCYNNGIICVDANRISRILRDGIDNFARVGVQETSLTLKNCSDFDIKFSIPFTTNYIGLFTCRQTSVTNSGYGIVFYPELVIVYNALNSTGDQIKTASYTSLVGTTAEINIIFKDSKIKVYINGTLMIDINDYANLYSGGITLPFNATNVVMTYLNEITASPLYTEEELIGLYPVPSNMSGNGINHPTGFGHAIIYLASFYKLIEAIKNKGKSLVFDMFLPTRYTSSQWLTVTSEWAKPAGKDLKYLLINGNYDKSRGIKLRRLDNYNYYALSKNAISQATTNLLEATEFAYMKLDSTHDALIVSVDTGTSITWDADLYKFE